ncbi:hypothetical protein JQK15_21815 [Sphingobium sp. BHU LFT2]|uniref:S10 family serine carboxypeptidase-like protein n=1 Tax=Sphingobium sp. BHU LFT2 TaxID=2807634 RepID=UPI001BEAB4F3|nr:hypothetical protein [Sphingobium sp. BHU LFT2]MBT2246145.1 hypothetical protein [Sphingobium sp. BHU LFT2]
MRSLRSASTAAIILASPTASLCAADKPAQAQAPEPAAEKRVVTSHVLTTTKGVKLPYAATAGTLLLKDKQGKPGASLFYVAYTVAPKAGERRPVTFFYNGGPGSSSIWLHMASFAPVRVPVDVEAQGRKGGGRMPRVAPNPDSLLDTTDMVFLDAVGTGYSRTLDPQGGKPYRGQ